MVSIPKPKPAPSFRNSESTFCPTRQAAINYMAYDAFRTLFKRVTGQKRIDAAPTLAIGAAAGVVSSTATYPLEVIRKRMQVHCLAKLTWRSSPPPFFPLFLLSRPPAFHGLPLSLPRFLSDRSFCQAFVDK